MEIVIVVVVFSLLTAVATATSLIYFDPDPSHSEPGNTTTVTLWLDTDVGVASFSDDIHFNTTVVNITDATAGDFSALGWWTFVHYGTFIRIGGMSPDFHDHTGHLKLADLTLEAQNLGSCTLYHTGSAVGNESGKSVSATWENGTFTCGECLGTCCNDENCLEPYATDMSCKECIDLGKWWKPNPDSACYNDKEPFDLCLDWCPQCCNGIDDDADESVDYPSDSQCTCGLDPSEVDPLPPIPELPTIFLFCAGLLTLMGYMLWKKRS